ncbi:MAG TPA: PDGLE domain-containing protein [Smithella sp.]|nr:PDGLE domain-containing protein [Smithella sp.]
MKITTKFWMGIVVLILLSPLGLILPAHFKAGSAWGEWSADEIQKLTGYVPQGFAKLAGLWNAPMPDYAFRGWEEKGLSYLSFAYILSAILGIFIIVAIAYLIGKLLASKGD